MSINKYLLVTCALCMEIWWRIIHLADQVVYMNNIGMAYRKLGFRYKS